MKLFRDRSGVAPKSDNIAYNILMVILAIFVMPFYEAAKALADKVYSENDKDGYRRFFHHVINLAVAAVAVWWAWRSAERLDSGRSRTTS